MKSNVGSEAIIKALLRMLRPPPMSLLAHELYAPAVVRLLKTIKNLSMDEKSLKVMEEAGAIPVLVPFLAKEGSQVVPLGTAVPASRLQMSRDVTTHVMHTLFNLCRVNHPRQNQAAEYGIIPALQNIIRGGGVLKQFALPILCELAAASPRTRELLSHHNGVAFYIDLLRESYWQMHAISAIHYWLTLDLDLVQGALLLPRSILALCDLFRCPHIVTFSSILPFFLGIVSRSRRLAELLGQHVEFMRCLVKRLQAEEIQLNAFSLSQLLKLLSPLLKNGAFSQSVLASLGVSEILQHLTEDDRVIVKDIAAENLAHIATLPAA